MSAATMPPVVVTGRIDGQLSRWLWLVKWLLALPHYLVLVLLWAAFVLTSVVAGVAILFTGRYPRSLFEFNAGVLRWSWRVAYYSYGALATDQYPPFTLRDVPEYPARLQILYPERLSRGLVLVKWWLLALPHYFVLAFFVGGAWAFGEVGDDGAGLGSSGLIGLLVLIAAIALAFTGRYPAGLFDLVLGMNRWVLRVAAYAGLMTDAYPPFRLDMGGQERATVLDVPPSPAPPGPPAPQPGGPGPGAGGVVALVLGALLALPSLGLLAGGGVALWAETTQRDSAGYLTSDSVALSTSTRALVTEPLDLRLPGPDDLYVRDLVGDLRIRATSESDAPLFVGLARTEDLERYLATLDHDVVTDIEGSEDVSYSRRTGSGAAPSLPADQDIWELTDTGTGTLELVTEARDGSWRAMVMNADGTPGLDVRADVAAEVPGLPGITAGLLAAGGLLAVASVVLLVVGIRASARGRVS